MSNSFIGTAEKKSLIRRYGKQVSFDVQMAALSRWKVGGMADVVVRPRSADELADLRAWINSRGLASVVVGATSNLLFSDEGVRAIIIQIGQDFSKLKFAGNEISAGPGVWVPGLAFQSMRASLTGLEHICGIPGTVGGLVFMNGGSQRKGIGDSITFVESVDECGNKIKRTREECLFSYRYSIYQEVNEIISAVGIRLDHAEKPNQVRSSMLAILRDRRRKFPQKQPSCGSVFVSDPAMYDRYGPPGRVIEMLGLKGKRIGGAAVSPRHANFIVNDRDASSEDILQLISLIRSEVFAATGYKMKVEIKYLKSSGEFVDV